MCVYIYIYIGLNNASFPIDIQGGTKVSLLFFPLIITAGRIVLVLHPVERAGFAACGKVERAPAGVDVNAGVIMALKA